ncbi:MAG: hypothetical protein ABIK28_17030 [Planctomycetota bacterium]
MTGRPTREAWLKNQRKDKLTDGTWYFYKIKPSITLFVPGYDASLIADYITVLVVKDFDSDQENTIAYMAYPNGFVMHWAPLGMLRGSNQVNILTHHLGYSLSSRKEPIEYGFRAS